MLHLNRVKVPVLRLIYDSFRYDVPQKVVLYLNERVKKRISHFNETDLFKARSVECITSTIKLYNIGGESDGIL